MVSRIYLVISALVIVLIPVRAAYAEWSIWEKNKQQQYQVDGRIKSIIVNEDRNEILIKMERASNGATESIRICALATGDDIQNFEQSEKMAMLRQALARGDRIQVSYQSPFDRCMASVVYESPKATVQKASAGDNDSI